MVLRSKQAKVLSQHLTKCLAWTRQTVREEGATSSLWALYLILVSDPRGLDGEATFRGWMV